MTEIRPYLRSKQPLSLRMGQFDVPKGMLDVSDLVWCDLDIHTGVEERIIATDVDGCTQVVFNLDNCKIFVVQLH